MRVRLLISVADIYICSASKLQGCFNLIMLWGQRWWQGSDCLLLGWRQAVNTWNAAKVLAVTFWWHIIPRRWQLGITGWLWITWGKKRSWTGWRHMVCIWLTKVIWQEVTSYACGEQRGCCGVSTMSVTGDFCGQNRGHHEALQRASSASLLTYALYSFYCTSSTTTERENCLGLDTGPFCFLHMFSWKQLL